MIEETTRSLIRLFRQHVEENTVLSAGSIVEMAKLPAIVLNGPMLTEKKRLMRDPERITAIDIEAGEAVREIPPRWYDLRFDVNISCESNLELVGLMEELSRLNQECPLLDAVNDIRERKYLWRWEKVPDVMTVPNISQVFQSQGRLIVFDVEIYSEIREVWPLIQKVSAEIDYDKIEVH